MIDLSIPVILEGVGMLFVVLAVVLIVRNIGMSRRRGAFDCSLERRGVTGRSHWSPGLMRFGTDRLLWFRALSLRVGPETTILRADLLDVSRRRLEARAQGEEDSYLVEFRLRGGRTELAIMGISSGAALNAWIEAAPTGLVIGDAD